MTPPWPWQAGTLSIHPVIKVITAGVLYFLIAIVCIYISFDNNIAQIWLSNAVLLIIIFRSNPRLGWWYLFAGMIGNVLANILTGSTPPMAVGLAFSNAVELVPALLLLEMMETPPGMPLIISTLVGSGMLAGFTASTMFPYSTGEEYLHHSLNWFSTDFLSILMLMPVGLSYTHERAKKLFQSRRLLELIAFSLISSLNVYVSVNYAPSPFLFITLVLLGGAFRLGLFGSTILCLITTTTFIFVTNIPINTPAYYTKSIYKDYGYILISLSLIPCIVIAYLIELRDRYDQKLKQSEETFKGALLYSAVGMSIVGPDGRWVTVNPALCEILDYTEDELLKMTFQDVTHPDDLARDLDLGQKVKNGEIDNYRMEKRYIRKNGEVIWIALVVSGIRDESGQLLYFIAQVENIDRRKRIEKALQDSEQRWKFALESGIQGVWDWNAETNTVYFSHTWKSMLGYLDEDIGDNLTEWTSRIHPDDVDEVMKKVNAHLEGKTDVYTSEHRLQCKDGHYKWILDRGKIISKAPDGKPLRLIGTHTDIEALKQAEQERQQLTQRLMLAIDAGKIGVFELNLKTGKLDWDNRMIELYDLKPNEPHDNVEDWAKHVVPSDLERVNQLFDKTKTSGVPFDTEFRIITRMNNIRYIRAKALPVYGPHKNIVSVLGLNWDVTQERTLTNELFEEKERLDITLKSIGDAVIVTDQAGLITFTSTTAQQLLECEPADVVNKRLDQLCEFLEDTDKTKHINPITLCLRQNEMLKITKPIKLILPTGKVYFIQYTVTPLRSSGNEAVGCVLVIHDVTTTQTLQRELEHQATHDELTELINRREFEEKLNAYLRDDRHQPAHHVLAFLDLDRFKIVNDTAGHSAGDALLKSIASILLKNTRGSDVVARIGGDEFAIILPHCSLLNATTIANHIVKAINTYRLHWDDKIYDIGISVGLVPFEPKSISLADLIGHADTACYKAKHLGGDSVAIFTNDEDATEKLHAEVKMVPRINAALEKNQFVLYTREIHPTTADETNKKTHEILLRMQDDEGNLVMPSQFIKVAERHHIMPSIDEWVLYQLLILKGKQFHARPDLAISINLSYQSIHTPSFHEKLKAWLSATTINPANIGFELTERALQENLDTTLSFLKLIAQAGCFVALDDFGSGLSSFTYLKNFPMKYVKIDSQFIRMLDQSEADRIIVESINTLAHRLDAKTIAEYVETPAILAIVKAMNIDYMQGNALSREVPLESIFQPTPQPSDTTKNV